MGAVRSRRARLGEASVPCRWEPIHRQSNTKLLRASSTNQATQEREHTQHCRMGVRLECHYNRNKLCDKLPMQDLGYFAVAKLNHPTTSLILRLRLVSSDRLSFWVILGTQAGQARRLRGGNTCTAERPLTRAHAVLSELSFLFQLHHGFTTGTVTLGRFRRLPAPSSLRSTRAMSRFVSGRVVRTLLSRLREKKDPLRTLNPAARCHAPLVLDVAGTRG